MRELGGAGGRAGVVLPPGRFSLERPGNAMGSQANQRDALGPLLKRCPFCGGVAVRDNPLLRQGCEPTEPDAYAYWIRCTSCAACGGWAKSWDGAERLWEMRIPDALPVTGRQAKPQGVQE